MMISAWQRTDTSSFPEDDIAMYRSVRSGEKLLRIVIVLAILISIAYHAALIFRARDFLPDRPFRDDAFYAFTVSRNIAIGRGITTADGSIPTNGIQPLFVLITTLPFIITSDKFTALRWIHGFHLFFHCLGALAIARLVADHSRRKLTPYLAAALWMVSYNMLKLCSNGLETGFYLLFLVVVCRAYLRSVLPETRKPGANLLFGVLLGLLTLTRIDTGLLCLAMAMHYTVFHRSEGPLNALWRGPLLWLPGFLLVTSPWWLYNIHLTGAPFPTSGLVQTMGWMTGGSFDTIEVLNNLWYATQSLLDQSLMVVLTPLRLIEHVGSISIAIIFAKTALLAVFIVVLRRSRKYPVDVSLPGLREFWFYPLFVGFLLIFYIFFFNVEWYMNRYLIPAILIPAFILPLILERYRACYSSLLLISAAAVSILIGGYSYGKRFSPMYTDHWGWVRDNVEEGTWVAASQSGTLGYFHDRTINTDGKVNSEIFGLPLAELAGYLTDRHVAYFIEWPEVGLFQVQEFQELFVCIDTIGTCVVYRSVE